MGKTFDASGVQGDSVLPTIGRLIEFLTSRRTPSLPKTALVQRISKHATLRHPKLTGARIECLEGSVWVTLDGDSRDVVLRAGQNLVVDRDGPALIHALEDACTRIDV